MAHYAFLNENNIVTEVITGKDEDDLQDGVLSWEVWYGNFRGQTCKRTSYNTYRDIQPILDENDASIIIGWQDNGSKHRYDSVPFRGKFAEIGDFYDEEKDEFISSKALEN